VNPDRIVVIYNAVPGGDRETQVRGTPAARDGSPFHFLFLGHLIPRKGVDHFLKAMMHLRERGMDVRGTLAGHGELRRYQEMAQALGIQDVCTFTGWVPHSKVEDLLGMADALVLPSLEEGLPMVILEALSCGVPVIATPVGSIGEVLSSGVDSLLVPPGDEIALADAMGRLVRNPELCRAFVDAGRRLFGRQFTVDAFMGRLLDAYNIAFRH
jgi:glycosyltransferase involved in cell wall biosynthesis